MALALDFKDTNVHSHWSESEVEAAVEDYFNMLRQEFTIPKDVKVKLDAEAERHAKATINKHLERNSEYFKEAREQPEKWVNGLSDKWNSLKNQVIMNMFFHEKHV